MFAKMTPHHKEYGRSGSYSSIGKKLDTFHRCRDSSGTCDQFLDTFCHTVLTHFGKHRCKAKLLWYQEETVDICHRMLEHYEDRLLRKKGNSSGMCLLSVNIFILKWFVYKYKAFHGIGHGLVSDLRIFSLLSNSCVARGGAMGHLHPPSRNY